MPAPDLALTRRHALLALAAAAASGARADALAPLAPDSWAEARVAIPAGLHRLAGPARIAEVAVATPPAFDATRAWPVLIVNATSDSGHQSSRQLLAAYRAAAGSAGWVALAADADPAVSSRDDTLSLRYALARTALAAVQPLWRDAGQAALAFAGFSGGAKYAGWLAALFASQHARVAGVFLSGVNEDPLAAAAREFGVLDEGFRATPVVLQGGRDDTVATPDQHREVERKLREARFRAVRLEWVDGGHRVDAARLPAALAWFAASGQ